METNAALNVELKVTKETAKVFFSSPFSEALVSVAAAIVKCLTQRWCHASTSTGVLVRLCHGKPVPAMHQYTQYDGKLRRAEVGNVHRLACVP